MWIYMQYHVIVLKASKVPMGINFAEESNSVMLSVC